MCSKFCYAKQAELQYPYVLPCRKKNLEDSKKKTFEIEMMASIFKRKRKYFRIHESGDFYSQAYLNKWITICKALPQVKFLTFTKAFKLDFSKVPSNLKIMLSVWPDTVYNDLHKAPLDKFPLAFTGDCGKEFLYTYKCSGYCNSCLFCWFAKHGESVHFKIH
jgi:hypothetical protein